MKQNTLKMVFEFVDDCVIDNAYVGKGFVDPSPKLRKWFYLGYVLIQIGILINSSILIYFGMKGVIADDVLVVSGFCVGVVILCLMCADLHKCLCSDDEDDSKISHNITETRQRSGVVEIQVVEPSASRVYPFIFMELLIILNSISNAFFYIDTRNVTRSYNEHVILLSWLNVALLLIACILFYFYSRNFVWMWPLPCIIFRFHRMYPKFIKVDRNMVARNGELDDFLIQEKYHVIPVDRVSDKKFFNEWKWNKFNENRSKSRDQV